MEKKLIIELAKMKRFMGLITEALDEIHVELIMALKNNQLELFEQMIQNLINSIIDRHRSGHIKMLKLTISKMFGLKFWGVRDIYNTYFLNKAKESILANLDKKETIFQAIYHSDFKFNPIINGEWRNYMEYANNYMDNLEPELHLYEQELDEQTAKMVFDRYFSDLEIITLFKEYRNKITIIRPIKSN